MCIPLKLRGEGDAPAALQKLHCRRPQPRPTRLCAQTAPENTWIPFLPFPNFVSFLTEALLSLKFIWICPHDLHES